MTNNRPTGPANPLKTPLVFSNSQTPGWPFKSARSRYSLLTVPVTALIHLVEDFAQFPDFRINTVFARADADRGAFGRAR